MFLKSNKFYLILTITFLIITILMLIKLIFTTTKENQLALNLLTSLRSLQQANSTNATILIKQWNFTNYGVQFESECVGQTYIAPYSDANKGIARSRFESLFQINKNLGLVLESLYEKNTIASMSSSELINSLISILWPILLFLFFSLVGWFTCCSCCCYEYCPIICKRKTEDRSSTVSAKFTPVIIVIFSGVSLIIPSVLGYVYFQQMMNTIKGLYCNTVVSSYSFGMGLDLERDNFPEWVGFKNGTYFEELAKLDWLQDYPDPSSPDSQVYQFKQQYNQLMQTFDNYYDLIQNSSYKEIVYPIMENQDLSIKGEPDFIQNFGTPSSPIEANSQLFLPKIKYYCQQNLYNFIEQYQNFTMEARYLKNHSQKLKEFLLKMNTAYQTTYRVLMSNNVVEIITNQILYGSVSETIAILQIFLLVFQLFVALLNIISSVYIMLGFRGTVGKYISHSSWCLSAFSLVILSVVIFCLYSIGVLIINLADLNRTLANENDILKSQTVTLHPDNFYLSCFTPYNATATYDYFGYKDISKGLDNFSFEIFRFVVEDRNDPFDVLNFVNMMKGYAEVVVDPTLALKNSNGTYPYIQLQLTLNRIVDYRHSLPYQVMNDCGEPTNIEFFIKSTDCSYQLVTEDEYDYLTLDDITNGEICLLINKVSSQRLEDLFKPILQNCTYSEGKYLDLNFNDLFSELNATHYILTAAYNSYRNYRNMIIDQVLLDAATSYKKLADNLTFFYNTASTEFKSTTNKAFQFPLTALGVYYSDPKHNLKDVIVEKLFTFTNYTSCSIFNKYMTRGVDYMTFNVGSAVYTLIVIYVFLMLYNILSAVFGLMSNMVNYKSKDEDDYEKKNN